VTLGLQARPVHACPVRPNRHRSLARRCQLWASESHREAKPPGGQDPVTPARPTSAPDTASQNPRADQIPRPASATGWPTLQTCPAIRC